MNVYIIAADGLLLLHTLFVAFVVAGLVLVIAGGLRDWHWVRNPWFRFAHVAAIVFVTVQSWAGRLCPLTHWEMALRALGGQEVYQASFVGHWLGRILYYNAPEWAFIVLYTAFCTLVIACWCWVRPRPLPWTR